MSSRLTMSDAPSPAAPQAPPAGASRTLSPPVRRGTSVRYYVCVGILLVSAATMQSVATLLGGYFQKQPAPLRKALDQMDPGRLAPEYTLHPFPAPPLDSETLQTLGTTEYLNWRLVDNRKPRTDPLCVAHVFVTFYTGKPDMVPHVPEECWIAGGFDPVGTPTTEKLSVPLAGADDDKLPVRVLSFQKRAGLEPGAALAAGAKMTVMYSFHTNGHYATTRNEVRLSQANLFNRYAYYAKVEVKFTDFSMRESAGRDESIAAMADLLRKFMPVLLEHLPDWNSLQSGGSAARTAAP